ncbi:winged-helix domain-containing protein [Cohnella sp. LGH]|uniref:Two-component system alkaline phosphatase synthesis response regulator PhoP n=1 Tax=Cohnella phaseoli TaxID=456490 RepID=A0A3D9IP74_9BACL|nr:MULTISPECIES: winged-helix domain-containing protein [Cohnella]QTH41481.1 winged-helix domain-containing protein [Cohnella sp. LGH]RED63535.1 two-component system alkaline phosphatase synthesis response regulator PhoP [Cohnella phaseoli]
MQQREQIRPLIEEAVLADGLTTDDSLPAEGDYCEITDRILIVSPRPAALRTLVAELARRCYDVLLLHHADDPLLAMIQGNIVVVDRTVEAPASVSAAWPSDGSSPVLALVSGTTDAYPGEETVVWPGPIDEVISKIQLLSVQHAKAAEPSRLLSFKDISLDPDRMTVTRQGSRIELTKTEYDLLRSILAAGGKVMTRQELMNEVWGETYFGGSNAIDVHIRSLRSKLDDDPKQPTYIATVRGAGYRLADA